MHWSDDIPFPEDPALAPLRETAQALIPSGRVVTALRHVPGRRVAFLVDDPGYGRAVLKVFASPRARGNDRRLRALRSAGAGDLVPTPIAVDPTGHAALLAYQEGTVFDEIEPYRAEAIAEATGRALAALHALPAHLDRCWTVEAELAQLRRRATPRTAPWIEEIAGQCEELLSEPLVVAHRDCHPRQVVVGVDSEVHWIDLDDAAMAPAALDVGNFVAHLRRDGVLRSQPHARTERQISAFLAGYGAVPGDLIRWERLALIRLAGLAERRHGRPPDAEAILGLCGVATR